MILGIGSDLIDIRRIDRALERHGDRMLARLYTPEERTRAERRPVLRAGTYAKRFAAKEACAKALGTGIRRGVYWRDMGVTNLRSGQLTGGAAARLAEITPQGYKPVIHVSLTDDFPLAQAFVVISAEPEGIPEAGLP
jgi:holo-[acyl-carrier protein] synthase